MVAWACIAKMTIPAPAGPDVPAVGRHFAFGDEETGFRVNVAWKYLGRTLLSDWYRLTITTPGTHPTARTTYVRVSSGSPKVLYSGNGYRVELQN